MQAQKKLSYSQDLWDSPGFAAICDRVEQGNKTQEQILSFLKDKVSLDNHCCNSLNKMAKTNLGTYETGSLQSIVNTFVGLSVTSAVNHEILAAKIHEQVRTPFSDHFGKLAKHAKKLTQEGKKLHRELRSNKNRLDKCKIKYETKMAQLYSVNTSLQSAKNADKSDSPSPVSDRSLFKQLMNPHEQIEKLTTRQTNLIHEVDESKETLIQAVSSTRGYRLSHDQQMAQILDQLQQIECDRRNSIGSCLEKYFVINKSMLESMAKNISAVSHSLEDLDIENDIQYFIASRKTGKSIPPLPDLDFSQNLISQIGNPDAIEVCKEKEQKLNDQIIAEAVIQISTNLLFKNERLSEQQMDTLGHLFRTSSGRAGFASVLNNRRNIETGLQLRGEAFETMALIIRKFLDCAHSALDEDSRLQSSDREEIFYSTIRPCKLVMIMTQSFYCYAIDDTPARVSNLYHTEDSSPLTQNEFSCDSPSNSQIVSLSDSVTEHNDSPSKINQESPLLQHNSSDTKSRESSKSITSTLNLKDENKNISSHDHVSTQQNCAQCLTSISSNDISSYISQSVTSHISTEETSTSSNDFSKLSSPSSILDIPSKEFRHGHSLPDRLDSVDLSLKSINSSRVNKLHSLHIHPRCSDDSNVFYNRPSNIQIPRRYIQELVQDHKLWRNTRFWEEAFWDSYASELKQHKCFQRWMAKSERVELERTRENILFSQLASWSHNMSQFGVDIHSVLQFVTKTCEANELDPKMFQTLKNMITSGSQSDVRTPPRADSRNNSFVNDLFSHEPTLPIKLCGKSTNRDSRSLVSHSSITSQFDHTSMSSSNVQREPSSNFRSSQQSSVLDGSGESFPDCDVDTKKGCRTQSYTPLLNSIKADEEKQPIKSPRKNLTSDSQQLPQKSKIIDGDRNSSMFISTGILSSNVEDTDDL